MRGGARALASYNKRGALANLLAVEEHLAQLSPGEQRSWCVKKHSLLACDHHLTEAINHVSRYDPRAAEDLRRVRDAAERTLRPGDPRYLPQLGDVAKLRNSLRRAFRDPTLGAGRGVCAKDGSALGALGYYSPPAPWHWVVPVGLATLLLGWAVS